MHTFIYPSRNTYITNETGYESSNFSLDSTLEVKAVNSFIPISNLYATQSISGSTPCRTTLIGFYGSFNGQLTGYASNVVAFFTGSASFSTSNFTGTVASVSYTNYSGSLIGTGSGNIQGVFSGSIYQISNKVSYLSGSLSGFTGSISSGSAYIGTSSYYSPTVTYQIVSTVSRTLMRFDLSAISSSIVNGDISNTGSLKYYLTLKNAQASELPISYTIYAYPLSSSWQNGDGRYQLGGSATGVSWNYRDYYNGTVWNNAGADYITSSNYMASQSYNNTNSDIKMNIGNIVNAWLNGSIANNGLILVTSLETSDLASNNTLRFFGTQTNTIYSPYLDVSWDDSVYNTGSMLPVAHPYGVVLQDVKKSYSFGSIARIDAFARPRNPLKNFVKGTQSNYYLSSSYLPTSSYYMIKDNESEEILIDFSENSKLSCDGYINYFMLDTTAFPQERYYKILIKTINSNGETIVFDHNNIFKITR
jgi:hypothetical protein